MNKGTNQGRQDSRDNREREARDNLFQDVVSVNRVTKVTRGGKRFSFSALAVVGNREGMAGFAKGKGKDPSRAVKKAVNRASQSMVSVSLKHARTLHHDINVRFGASRVLLRSAPQGTGVIAGGAMRSVFEAFGVQDVVSKSIGSPNSHTLVRATFEALQSIASPRSVAQKRHKRVSEIFATSKGARPVSTGKKADQVADKSADKASEKPETAAPKKSTEKGTSA